MKKQIALGLLAAVAAGGAFAQSSVTVYGRLNVTVESSKYGEDGDRQGEVNNNSSRIGFKGTEDLGGGLKAGFQIEHGFDATTGTQNLKDDGTPAAFWGRQAEVNLGGAFGTIRLGNFTPESYYATADYISMHNHDTGTSSDALYDFTTYVTANKVGYASPNFSGFNFHVSVAEGSAAVERTYDLAANYQGGPLHLGAGFSKTGDVRQFAIRGLYEFGAFTVGALVQRSSIDDADRTYFRLSGMYTMGASEFHLNFGRAGEIDGIDDSEANQWTVGYNYNLSKRTKVYTYYTAVKTGDSSIAGVPVVLYGGDRNHIAVGIRHNF